MEIKKNKVTGSNSEINTQTTKEVSSVKLKEYLNKYIINESDFYSPIDNREYTSLVEDIDNTNSFSNHLHEWNLYIENFLI